MKHLKEVLDNLNDGARESVLYPVLTACVKDGIINQLTVDLIKQIDKKKGKKK
jgi:hypothetical protein